MTSYNQQIEDMLLEEDEIYQLQQDQTWRINDLGKAVWADGLVHEIEMKIEEIEQIYKERMESYTTKLNEWKEKASKKHVNDIEFFKTHLHAYHQRIIAEEEANKSKKKTKTIKLPYRSLTIRDQAHQILVNGKEVDKAKNDPELIALAKIFGDNLIKEEVKWADLKKSLKEATFDDKPVYIDSEGNVIEFIQLIERPAKLDWTLNKE